MCQTIVAAMQKRPVEGGGGVPFHATNLVQLLGEGRQLSEVAGHQLHGDVAAALALPESLPGVLRKIRQGEGRHVGGKLHALEGRRGLESGHGVVHDLEAPDDVGDAVLVPGRCLKGRWGR